MLYEVITYSTCIAFSRTSRRVFLFVGCIYKDTSPKPTEQCRKQDAGSRTDVGTSQRLVHGQEAGLLAAEDAHVGTVAAVDFDADAEMPLEDIGAEHVGRGTPCGGVV